MKNNFKYLPIDTLIAELKNNGFIIGVDTYLKLEYLLQNLDIHKNYDKLNTLLCPLFATEQREQDLFYQIFENVFETHKPPEEDEPIKEELEEEQTSKSKKYAKSDLKIKKRLFWGIGIILSIIISIFFIFQNNIQTNNEQIAENKTEDTLSKINNTTEQIENRQNEIKDSIEELSNDDNLMPIDTVVDIKPDIDTVPDNKSPIDTAKTIEKLNEDLEKGDSILRILDRENYIQKLNENQQKAEIKHKKANNLLFLVLGILLVIFISIEIYKFIRRKLIANIKDGK